MFASRSEPRASSLASPPRARAAGFTLLEVMAAVAIFGLIYSVLASVGVQGLRAEGEADRRLRASLLADNRFGEFEAQLIAGAELPIAENEDEVDEFTVYSSVSALELGIPELPEAATRRRRDTVGAESDAAPKEPAAAGSFFKGAGPGNPPPMRKLEVRVVWTEGVGEREVRRTGFGLDRAAAEPLLSALDEAQAQAKGEATQENENQATNDQATPEAAATTGSKDSKKSKGSKKKPSTSSVTPGNSSETKVER